MTDQGVAKARCGTPLGDGMPGIALVVRMIPRPGRRAAYCRAPKVQSGIVPHVNRYGNGRLLGEGALQLTKVRCVI